MILFPFRRTPQLEKRLVFLVVLVGHVILQSHRFKNTRSRAQAALRKVARRTSNLFHQVGEWVDLQWPAEKIPLHDIASFVVKQHHLAGALHTPCHHV